MNATNYAVVITLTMIFMMSLWCIDVSTSCMINSPNLIRGECYMYGILNKPTSPVVAYHIGMIQAILAFASTVFYLTSQTERKWYK